MVIIVTDKTTNIVKSFNCTTVGKVSHGVGTGTTGVTSNTTNVASLGRRNICTIGAVFNAACNISNNTANVVCCNCGEMACCGYAAYNRCGISASDSCVVIDCNSTINDNISAVKLEVLDSSVYVTEEADVGCGICNLKAGNSEVLAIKCTGEGSRGGTDGHPLCIAKVNVPFNKNCLAGEVSSVVYKIG